MTEGANFIVKVYYQDSLNSSFKLSEIDDIRFENDGNNDKWLNIYVSGLSNGFKLIDIDSLIFVSEEEPTPEVTDIAPGAGLVGSEVKILGTGFGNEQGAGFVSFTNVIASEYISWTNTEIIVKVPVNAKSGNVSVTTNKGKKSNEVYFQVIESDKLQIISINPTALKIGDELDIQGTKFGNSRGNSYVNFNEIKAKEYNLWKDNEIKVIIPKGAKSGKVSVNVNNEKSNELNFSIIPHINSIMPDYGGITDFIEISGIGFGDSLGTGKVFFNDIEASNYKTWNDSIISVQIPNSAKSGIVYVAASGNKSNEMPFTIIHHITGISPKSVRIGDEMTIIGTNFGNAGGLISFNGINESQFISWNDTNIRVKVPLKAKTGKLSIIIDNKKSNEVEYTIIPQIESIAPLSAITGTTITITGTGFGDSLGIGKVTFKRLNVTNFSSWKDTEIKLRVPTDAESGKIYVTVGTEKSNEMDFIVLPQISSIIPNVANIGEIVVLSGSGFGDKRDTNVVSFTNAIGTNYIYWGIRSIEVRVPAGAKTGKVSVTVHGNKSNEVDLTITTPPTITNISPNSGYVGSDVTITGSDFGYSRGSSIVSFKNATATEYLSWTDNQIKTKVPNGAQTGKVSVTVNGKRSNEVDFTVTSPPVESVTIGNQTWMKKNLDVTTYRNGDPIPQVANPTEWAGLTTGAWCYYNNDESNNATYGKLYNWYAINDPRGIAPEGWHVPSNEEMTALSNYLGGDNVAGSKLKETGTSHWNSPNSDATNESGFTALPGGYRWSNGTFYDLRTTGSWWTSTEYNTDYPYYRRIYYNNSGFYNLYNQNKTVGFSIRCIKD